VKPLFVCLFVCHVSIPYSHLFLAPATKETDYRISILHNIKVSFFSPYWLVCHKCRENCITVKNVVTMAVWK